MKRWLVSVYPSIFVPVFSALILSLISISATGCGAKDGATTQAAPAPNEAGRSPAPESVGDDSPEEPSEMASEQNAIFHNVRDALVARPGGFEAYIFYLHGRIIEDGDRRPTHPKYGVYEYDQVLRALAIPDVAVISEARAAKTDAVAYAGEIVSQLRVLFSSGIEPSKVTVIGFSKGGVIALMVSHLLGHDDVGFVVLAACGSWLDGGVDGDPLRLHGRMLSIHEASDPIGPCRSYVEPSLPGLFFHEIEVAIGGSHGAFYQPHQDWLDQTLLWTGAPSIRSQMVRPERVEPEQGL